MKSNFNLITLAFISFIFVHGCDNAVNNNKANKNTNSAVVTSSVEPLASPVEIPYDSKLNAANFVKLETGMKYAEVAKILGSKGEILSEGENAGAKIVMYKWSGAGGSFIKVVFQDGKLLDKVQTGLR